MGVKDFVKLNKDTYDKIANLFHSTRQYLWDDMVIFKKYLHSNMSVLDIGCGTGRLYQLLQDFQGVEYLGIDQSEGQIDVARKNFPHNNYLVAEMTKLPVEDKKFDLVFCIAVLHHLPTIEMRVEALNEIKRVLKPGGYLLMTNWNMDSASAQKTIAKGKWFRSEGSGYIVSWSNPQGEKIGDRYYYGFSLEELNDLLISAGFKVLENYYSKKGKKSDKESGANIVTVARM